MEEVQALSEDLRLVIQLDPQALTGVQTAEAPLQLLLISSGWGNLAAAADECFIRVAGIRSNSFSLASRPADKIDLQCASAAARSYSSGRH
jgi:hypothetical protein